MDAPEEQPVEHSLLRRALIPTLVITFAGVFVWDVRDLGPLDATYPRALALVLFVLAVASFLSSKHFPPDGEGRLAMIEGKTLRIILISFGFALLVPRLGFIAATTVATPVTMWLFGMRRIMPILLMTVGLSAGIYLLFIRALGVPLPSGLLAVAVP
jgi:putative tricarboxylic transport membrane protein